jgi:hypothetical protein
MILQHLYLAATGVEAVYRGAAVHASKPPCRTVPSSPHSIKQSDTASRSKDKISHSIKKRQRNVKLETYVRYPQYRRDIVRDFAKSAPDYR